MRDSPRMRCVWRITPIYTWRQQAIIEWSHRMISNCWLLPQCEVLHTCHSGFLNATVSSLSLDQFYQVGLYDGKKTLAMLLSLWRNKHCLVKFWKFWKAGSILPHRQNIIHGSTWADQDWIGPIIFKNFADQDWIGFNFCGSGLDSDWKISQSSHLCCLHNGWLVMWCHW